ncbi:preprotein translocase subunit SecE [Nesterenkonia marinintestina]|uniref:preprotein translocase subunit SecE n=1 Tax=Nesterenkonia marinintestina TaxID=2979865 RepID=UPI0028FC285C|nr:preprotein translocase subunit SecE [Nesterenkonia sp. GX14115]
MSQTPSQEDQGRSPDGGSPRGPFGKVWLFLRQVVDELKKVVVPTRRELTNYTLVVLVFVVIVILLVTGLDRVFSTAAEWVFGDGAAEAPAEAPMEQAPEDAPDGDAPADDAEQGQGDDS